MGFRLSRERRYITFQQKSDCKANTEIYKVFSRVGRLTDYLQTLQTRQFDKIKHEYENAWQFFAPEDLCFFTISLAERQELRYH